MSKVDLASKQWCDLVFEGRNKAYGAYRARANKGKFQLRAIIIVIIAIVAIVAFIFAKTAVENAIKANRQMDGQEETVLQELKKDELKKEEPKVKAPEPEPQPQLEKVAVKASIQFTVPKIVEDDKVDRSKELKTQDDVTKSNISIASMDYKGDVNGKGTVDDLKEGQTAGGTQAQQPEPEVFINDAVEVPATYPGGDEALLQAINRNLKYPQIALDQELQGVVILRFQVGRDGSISQIKVEKSLSTECDNAAKAALKKLSRFIPAKQQGHPVPVWFRLPVRFRIQ